MTIPKLSLYIISILLFIATFYIAEYPKFKRFNDGLLHVYFLDVGQGDSELIKSPSKKLILIDGGPKVNLNDEISNEIPFTVKKIDLVIISHSHADHIAGISSILSNYDVGCIVYDWQDPSGSEMETNLRGQIKDLNIRLVTTANLSNENEIPTDCFYDMDIHFDIYSLRNISEFNASAVKKDQNLESNMVLLNYRNFQTLFTGDAEIPVQTDLLPQINADIEVLKAAHHGSINGFYPPLIAKLKPEVSVISVGVQNRYGHPNKETISGYQNLNLKWLRTDLNGSIDISSDGKNWQFATAK